MDRNLIDTIRHRLAERLRRPSWVLLVELFIGLGWTRAVVEKLIDPTWWSGEAITSFVTERSGTSVAWYRDIAVEVWIPLASSLAVVVVLLQAVAAFTLVSGRFIGTGLAVGMFLNLHFVLAGAVDPSIFYLVCQGALALHLLERRRDAGGRDVLEVLNVGAIALFLATAPTVQTLHPADVIHDPSMVLAMFGGLVFVTTASVLARTTPASAPQARPGPAGAFRSPTSAERS